MKKCNNCDKFFSAASHFCADCGSLLVDITVCPNCGKEIENEEAAFCSGCGAKIDSITEVNKTNIKDTIQTSVDKLKDNEFVKSVRNDFQNSQSVGIIKDKVKDATQNVKNTAAKMPYYKKKKIAIFAGIAAIIIILLLIVTSIHTCDECDKTYLGKKHEVTFWGETENLCKDCYNDFYGYFN
ncbi:MAG: zinc-ribbon domain-containing protein [Eubacterium sp.]|nr:zinc-ribbon domain-containing protein [Eubacterium sp.]